MRFRQQDHLAVHPPCLTLMSCHFALSPASRMAQTIGPGGESATPSSAEVVVPR